MRSTDYVLDFFLLLLKTTNREGKEWADGGCQAACARSLNTSISGTYQLDSERPTIGRHAAQSHDHTAHTDTLSN